MVRGIIAAVGAAILAASLPAGAGDRQPEDGALRRADAGYHKLLVLGGRQVRWAGAGTRPIRWALMRDGEVRGERNCRRMGPADRLSERSSVDVETLRRSARDAFARWSAAARIDFEETEAAQADILIGTVNGIAGVAWADVSTEPEGPGRARLTRALVCLNVKEVWTTVADGDTRTRELGYTLTHEIGHTIGLDHPGRSGALMAYAYDEAAGADLAAGDVRAAQALYGPR